jgi:hypothetical protein
MLCEMNNRPVLVAAQAVELSVVLRSIADTAGPARSPMAASVSGTGPAGAQSPHCAVKVPVHSLQMALASASVRLPRP